MANRSSMEKTRYPGVYKRGERYVVVYHQRGRQHKRAFRTLTEARRFKSAADGGASVPTARRTVVDYAGGWLDGYTGRTSYGLAESTRASYKDVVDRVIVPYFRRVAPALKLDELRPSDVRSFIAHLAAQGHKPATVRRYFAPLRAMLATAFEDGLTDINAAAGVRVVVPGASRRQVQRLTPVQTRALLAEIPADHADLVYLLAATGLRIGEALALDWADYGHDEDGPLLTVNTSKTRAGLRTIALSPQTARVLDLRRSRGDGAGLIFSSTTGGAIDARSWRRRVFAPAAGRAGVAWATPHSLRHGMASLMADHGYSAAQIATQLGHADGGALALRVYVHPERMAAPAFVDEALSESTPRRSG